MEKLTLSNPITINGKKVKTLTYDTGAITCGPPPTKPAAAPAPASWTTPCTPTSP